MSRATILCCPQITPLDARLARLTEFLGIECSLQTLRGQGAGLAPDSALLGRDHQCLMVSAAALGSLTESEGAPGQFLQRLLDRTKYLLVYGFRPDASDASIVRQLSQGLVESLIGLPRGYHEYTISSDWRPLTKEFTGLVFGPIQSGIDSVFSGPSLSPALRPIISIAGSPSFAAFTRGGCTIFILGTSDIADVDMRLKDQLRVVDWFSRVIPAAMFLRHALGRHRWHRPQPSASFIIDDLLLKETYGFLNYRQLLRATSDQSFAATIAFIPYNFRRSQASVVDLFRSHPNRLSLCIHGCDHTGGEFATTNLLALNAMARLADDRMRAHEKTTALPYGKIMVFPQGRFSAASLKALQSNGYMAAVNTSPIPEDSAPGDDLTLGEWLDVAVTRYHGFPLFVRRYPGELVNFAFDLFFGKTLLIVEHHTAFKHGYRDIAAFVAALNSLNPHLRWAGLREALSHSYLQRDLSNDTVGVRLWTSYTVLSNAGTSPKKYLIQKVESAEASLRQVLVDGCPADYVLDNGLLRMAIEIQPLAARVVEIRYANNLPSDNKGIGLRTTLGIHARRRLSEFRDDFLCWQHRLQTLAGLGDERRSS